MKIFTVYIKFYFAFLLIVVIAGSARSQQILQTFSEVNSIGYSRFAYSISTAGDVNNDGYSDIIVGAPDFDTYQGRAYIYYGGSPMDSVPDVILDGDSLDYFGYSVCTAGDVNNDGYSDVIVGAYGYNSYTGRAYIYYGGSPMDSTRDVILTGEGTNNYFGYSVCTAGNVNKDGYSDVIVGAYGYNSNSGRAYLYYGSSSMDNTPDIILTGEGTGNEFGISVSTAGDVNNDGYSDVIVGAFRYNSYTGQAYIFYGSGSMDTIPDVTFIGEGTNNRFGLSVSTAGDVNKDGYSDVIVGALGYNSYTGRAYIYYGGSPMDSIQDVILMGEGTNNQFGSSVSTAGDVNNDGYSDVIVGAPYYNSNTGRVYIYYGGSSMDNTPDVTLTGEGTSNYFGWSVGAAGDVNNNGYSDVIVGTPYYNTHTGRAYIYYGGSSMNNTSDITLTGEMTENDFGISVSTAGDVNNDGYSDIIVGAPGYNTSVGRAYIYYGGSSMNNTPDVTLTGEGTSNYFGWSVSTAGDVNNDGYSDVIVGAYGYNSYTGRAYIYYGGSPMNNTPDVTLDGLQQADYFGSAVSTAGDVNNDGYSDVIVGAYEYDSYVYQYTGEACIYYGGNPMNNVPDVYLTGQQGYLLGSSVSTAGDVNNDGYSDVIVGAYGYNSYTGLVFIYYGGNPMNSTADVILTGENTGDEFGSSVSTAGDVNNDGYSDVIVGAYGYNSYTGRAYIYYGGSPMDGTRDVILTGEGTNNQFGSSVSTAGDVNNDGFSDVIVGAPYSSNTGRAYIYYGGSTMDNIPDVTFDGGNENFVFGYSVSTAGDINNDGYSDVIVGDFSYNWNTGKAYIYKDNSAVFVTAKLKIFLEGPYAGNDKMYTDLNYIGYLGNDALSQPYNTAPWNYTGSEFVTSDFFNSNPAIVDWVLVQLRTGSSPSTATTVVTERAAFINSDGSIVDTDGVSDVKFNGVSDGNYYVVIMHRNHLAVMSAGTVALSGSSSTLYDFTTGSGQFYGGSSGAKELETGVWGMIAGDGNGNGQVQNNDSENIWKPDNGTSGYKNSDFNMNGQVQNNDNENYWKPNNGRGTQAPNEILSPVIRVNNITSSKKMLLLK